MWCLEMEKKQDLKQLSNNDKHYDSDAIKNILVNSSKEINDNFLVKTDKKVIEQLKLQVEDLVVKLENCLGRYYESEYKARKAEEKSELYNEVTEKKIKENKELQEEFKNLDEKFQNLSIALNNAKNEIVRLNREIELKDVNYEELKKDFENYKNEILEKEIFNQKEKEQFLAQIEERNIALESKQYIKMSPLRSPITNSLTSNLQLESNLNKTNIQSSFSQDDLLKFQLEIVDLKKKIQDEETNKTKFNEILKKKKDKNKLLKIDIEKLIHLFQECGKEVKWKQDLVTQKNSMIKILKEKTLEQQKNYSKLKDNYEKVKGAKHTCDFGVTVNLDNLIPVYSHPELF